MELKDYMLLAYTILLLKDDNTDDYCVAIRELPGCMSQGEGKEDALRMIIDAQKAWIQTELEDGVYIPIPDICKSCMNDESQLLTRYCKACQASEVMCVDEMEFDRLISHWNKRKD